MRQLDAAAFSRRDSCFRIVEAGAGGGICQCDQPITARGTFVTPGMTIQNLGACSVHSRELDQITEVLEVAEIMRGGTAR